jgi:hypothetical protein
MRSRLLRQNPRQVPQPTQAIGLAAAAEALANSRADIANAARLATEEKARLKR